MVRSEMVSQFLAAAREVSRSTSLLKRRSARLRPNEGLAHDDTHGRDMEQSDLVSRQRDAAGKETPNKRRRMNSMPRESMHLEAALPLGEKPTQSSDKTPEMQSEVQPSSVARSGSPLAKKDIFPFMQLAAELRLYIYQIAFLQDEPIALHIPKPMPTSDQDNMQPKPAYQLSLCGTSTGANLRRPVATTSSSSSSSSIREDTVIRNVTPFMSKSCRNFFLISKTIYNEARQVLYGENRFVIEIDSGIHTLSMLHQRTRNLIRTLSVTIPSHHDIIDGFADLVRLGLRYCWGLKNLYIILPDNFPDDRILGSTGNIYANAFRILRWLPQGCKVRIVGGLNVSIRKVVEEEGRLMGELDERAYSKRQHQMPDRR